MLADQSRQHLQQVCHDNIQIQHDRSKYLLTTEGQQLTCQRRSPIARDFDLLGVPPERIVRAEMMLQEFAITRNHGEQIIKVMILPIFSR